MIYTSYKMIPDDYMYCKSAFPYENMDNIYLKEMDEKEKKISEKENEQLKESNKKMINYGIAGAAFLCTCWGTFFKICEPNRLPTMLTAGIFAASAGGGYSIGAGIGSNEPLKETINLRRMDRIDDKMRDIMAKISQDYCQTLTAEEVKELEKAHTYFSNRLFDYKADRSKTGSTHIGAQYITYSPNVGN